MKTDITKLIDELLNAKNDSRSHLVQVKVDRALADIKRARTLIEKAQLTAQWAERCAKSK
jgi:hypothetical protein